MSCVPIPEAHQRVLDLLRRGPLRQTDLEQQTGCDFIEPVRELRAWGWVFGDLELSGVGWYHAGFLPGGILHRTAIGYVPRRLAGAEVSG